MIELNPIRHESPPGWPAGVFETLTDSISAVLVSAYRRGRESETALDGDEHPIQGKFALDKQPIAGAGGGRDRSQPQGGSTRTAPDHMRGTS